MPYAESTNLPFESASKLGHLSVVEDPLVKQLLSSFQAVETTSPELPTGAITQLDLNEIEPLAFVIAVDGSVSSVPNSLVAEKTLAYIKVASLCMSMDDLQAAQRPIVDPAFVQQLMSENTNTLSTVLPLNNVGIPGRSVLDTIRSVLRSTFDTVCEGRLLDTLLFLTSRAWDPSAVIDAHFACALCGRDIPLPRGVVDFDCPACGKALSIVDYLGIQQEVNEDSNEDSVARSAMLALEHLTVIDYVRRLAERNPAALARTLVLKDGPLLMSSQYARIVEPIRQYLGYLASESNEFYIAGIEKSGPFVTHAHFLGEALRGAGKVFIPGNEYILTRIKHMGPGATIYGERVLYGTKCLVGLDERNVAVPSVASAQFKPNATLADLPALPRILKTLSQLVSRQYQDAVVPIVAANGLASMSFYPSNDILAKYASAMVPGLSIDA